MTPLLRRLPRPIKSTLKSAALGLLNARERWSGSRSDTLFVMGHMRSGSTLLTHVLMSHPDIMGYGERNAHYATPDDLDRMKLDMRGLRRDFLSPARYFVDQINHTKMLSSPTLLKPANVRTIFLIREPETALASMVDVLGQHFGMTLEQAVTYYQSRLDDLAGLATGLNQPGKAFFLTYADLVGDTAMTLDRLTAFLGLGTPLSPAYQRFDFTGKRGDPGAHIGSGGIQSDTGRAKIALPPKTAKGVQKTYADCHDVLSDHCTTIGR